MLIYNITPSFVNFTLEAILNLQRFQVNINKDNIHLWIVERTYKLVENTRQKYIRNRKVGKFDKTNINAWRCERLCVASFLNHHHHSTGTPTNKHFFSRFHLSPRFSFSTSTDARRRSGEPSVCVCVWHSVKRTNKPASKTSFLFCMCTVYTPAPCTMWPFTLKLQQKITEQRDRTAKSRLM